MRKEVKLEYSFEGTAEILDRNSEKLREYETYFEEKILPEIKEIEKEKTESRKVAYQIRVSAFSCADYGDFSD